MIGSELTSSEAAELSGPLQINLKVDRVGRDHYKDSLRYVLRSDRRL